MALVAVIAATAGARADELNGCDGQDPEQRIAPCTALIEAPGTDAVTRAKAFYLRGLAYAKLSQYQRAIPDFDAVIRLTPWFAPALNGRADAYLKLGRPSESVTDIERALTFAPQDPVYNATRGEIRQALGDHAGAIGDHEAAMAFGGMPFVRLYQCNLKLAQLYHGPVDGIVRPELHMALALCVNQGTRCAPLPPFPIAECPEPVG